VSNREARVNVSYLIFGLVCIFINFCVLKSRLPFVLNMRSIQCNSLKNKVSDLWSINITHTLTLIVR
jgi:hypothetical protein